jgi:S-DNA-T family DNA segregation ATPase FtsK/SpoIIIE
LGGGGPPTSDTDHCTFVLVDFKGGAAFDRLVALPHVVGSVTDLDEHLAARALCCLEAELRRRERLLRDARAGDITAYVRARRADPSLAALPRLVVVVDEFATLVAELPDFVDALVDMAQRGRSLGVHLVLATQRPAGAVKDSIRTNTNLRIALRVVDGGDSRDVVGCDDAAHLPVHRPGRAVARCGSGEPTTFQTALISDRRGPSASAPVRARRWLPTAATTLGDQTRDPSAPPSDDTTPTDLELLVDAVCAAHDAAGLATPTRPWPDPLPDVVTHAELVALGGDAAFALADAPHRQAIEPCAWRPDGNLVVAGLPGSGVTSAMRAILLSLARTRPAESLHAYVVTTDVDALRPLERLPHCGAVIAVDDLERAVRLLRTLGDELRSRRQATTTGTPTIVTVVDGVAALRRELEAAQLIDEIELLEQLAAEGPAAGLVFVLGAEHPGAIGHRIERTASQRLL